MKKGSVFFVVSFIILFAAVLTASADFQDDFTDEDYKSNGWYTHILLGYPEYNYNYIYPARKKISFHIPNYDTALYFLNSNTSAADSTVEAEFENVLSRNSQYGIVCRFHEYGWYEFRIVVSGEHAGSYTVLKYDQSRKTEGKNPYVTLHPGMDRFYSYDIKLGLNSQNTLKMICEGNNIRVFINEKEQFPIRNGIIQDNEYTDGTSGIMIWSQVPGGNAQIDVSGFRSVFEN